MMAAGLAAAYAAKPRNGLAARPSRDHVGHLVAINKIELGESENAIAVPSTAGTRSRRRRAF